MQQTFNEDWVKSYKDAKIVQLIQKYMKLTKAARTSAENSTWLHSDSFEINTYKSQDNESVIIFSTQRKLSSLESDKKSTK